MELTGNLIVKNETKEYGSNGFKKREFVIKTNDSQYPQEILIELVQDKCELINKFNINDNIKVSININGRSWINPQGETKYFNSIQGWNINSVAESAPAVPQAEPSEDLKDDEHDDLPF